MADNPAAQEGFNPRFPFQQPIQGWIEGHKNELADLGVSTEAGPVQPLTMTVTQVVVMGLLKRVTDLERQTDNMDRAIMQLGYIPRGGRTRRRRHTRVLGVQ